MQYGRLSTLDLPFGQTWVCVQDGRLARDLLSRDEVAFRCTRPGSKADPDAKGILSNAGKVRMCAHP